MFMIVSYPWPVASAHVQFPGTSPHALRTHQTARTAAADRSHNPQDQDQDQAATQPAQQRRILTAPKV
jgi:hypothetical protein